MGKIKYLKKVREFFRKTPIVTISSLKKIIKKDNGYIYLMLNNMVCSGEIYRITRRIKSKYFFGFEYKKYGDFYVPVSDIEKTLIDLVYFCQPLDREVVHNFRTKLNMKKLQIYIKRYDSSTAEKVLAVINGKQKHILR